MRRRDLVLLVPVLAASAGPDSAGDLADIIVPGAAQARIGFFIETTLRHSPQELRDQWARGVEALAIESKTRFGKPFAQLSREQQTAIVAFMASGEANPASELERFFVLAKRLTIDGYVLSDDGQHKWLGVDGDAHGEFSGCTHPEHQHKP